jgi:hypothetical protein
MLTRGRFVLEVGAEGQPAAAAAVASAPARGAVGLAYKQVLGLECEVGTVLGVSGGDERALGPELA